MVSLSKIMKNGKALYLAYDQGLEHGPTDFNDRNVNPEYILDIAKKGKFNAVIFQKGIAEKYYNGGVPLILKLNGKTNLLKGEPLARQLCSIEEALKLKARAIGYTIYVGSKYESVMFKEFEKIQEQAHKKNLPVIAWMYPRGKNVKNELSRKILAYAARIGLELGADIIKIKYNGNKDDLRWIVKCAGKCKVVIAGGVKKDAKLLFKQVKDIMDAGAMGLAIGRNVWQSKEPLKIVEGLKEIIFNN